MLFVRCSASSVAAICALVAGAGCSSSPSYTYVPVEDGALPEELPFELIRPAAGQAPTTAETSAFTQKITGFWSTIDYFRWVTWHSHGLHPSYDASMPDYMMWWQDTRAVKAGDTITFQHYGGADNIMIRTPKVLSQALSGFMASGDPLMREIAVGYPKGVVALFQGLVFGNEDPVAQGVTARAIFTHNHSYETTDGRKVAVDYDPAKVEKYDWNAHTVPNPDNPYFGSIWVRNMRSKDDVPHLFRLLPLLKRVAQNTDDADVRASTELAVEYLTAFAKDIVDHGYQIRTKENGEVYVPEDETGGVADLASFVKYEELSPNGECTAKLAAALIGYGQPLWNDCDDGINGPYEDLATTIHYFNYAIVRYFHLAAITNALAAGEPDTARTLLDGLVERIDAMVADDSEREEHWEWDADVATFLLAAAASGLPLTAAEAQIVQRELSLSVDHYLSPSAWREEPCQQGANCWDLWDASVPDGQYDYKPTRDDPDEVLQKKYVRPEELAYLLHYCYSPWKNPAGVEPVDCDVVLDPSRWGQ